MEHNLSEISQKLSIALLNTQSNQPYSLKETEAFVSQLQQDPLTFCSSLIEILTIKDDNALRLSCAIQLKNCIMKQWKIAIFTEQLKDMIKKTILKLLVNSKEKNELKQYKAIIKKILKYDGPWNNYINEVIFLINSTNQNPFEKYCGVLCLWLLANKYEFEIDNRQIFDNCYALAHNHLLQTFLALIQKSELNEFEVKYICRIIKVWLKTIKIQPPIDFTHSFNVFYQHIIQFTPKNIQLRRNCLVLLEAIYQKYFDVLKPKNNNDYASLIYPNRDQYMLSLFIYFYSYIIDKDKHTITNTSEENEKSIASCYNFLLLAMNRNEKEIMSSISTNLSSLIIASIRNNMLSQSELESDERNFLYDQFDVPTYSKRKTISQFIEKLASIKALGWNAIDILMNQLVIIDIEKQKENTKCNVLLKESAIFLMMKMIQKQMSNDKVSILIHDIVGKYISNEITVTNILNDNMNRYAIALRLECINFLNLITESTAFTNEEIHYLINSLSEGLLLQGHLIIKTISAITLSNVITYSEDSIAFSQNSITKLLSLYLILIKEIELDELIFSIENIINHYPKQSLTFAPELSKELIVIFHAYICQLKECDNDEKTNIDDAACGIIDLLSALITLSNEQSDKFNEVLLICNDMMLYALSEECGLVSMIVYERAIYITTNLIELVTSIPPLMWKWLNTLLNSIVLMSPNSTTSIKGIGYDSLHKIIPIVFYFIIKDPNTFISIYDKTLQLLEAIISIGHTREDELSCTYAIKILIAIFETYDTNTVIIFKSLERLLPLLIKELSLNFNKQMYLQFLIQLIALIIKFNPEHVLHYLHSSNQLKHLLNKWMTAINSMQHEFEYRRSIYGLFSMLCLPGYLTPSTIIEHYMYLSDKVIEVIDKLIILTEKKKKNIEEAEVSGEVSEDEAKEEGNVSNQDDFIEQDDDDDVEYNEIEDDDYSPEDEEDQSIKTILLTKLEKQNVFDWIKSMLNYMKPVNNGDQYKIIVSKIKNPVLISILNNIN